jgi:hypothetical protein
MKVKNLKHPFIVSKLWQLRVIFKKKIQFLKKKKIQFVREKYFSNSFLQNDENSPPKKKNL